MCNFRSMDNDLNNIYRDRNSSIYYSTQNDHLHCQRSALTAQCLYFKTGTKGGKLERNSQKPLCC